MASLSLKGIQKIYPNGFHAVKDFNLEIADKEFIIFVGPSGCGKSTTLRMIAGLEDISDGTFKIDGKVMNNVEAKDRDNAMVFQNYALYPHMTVYDNMAFGLKLRKVPKAEIDKKVREAARILDLEKLLDRKPKALSGGQRQRVAMGRAIVRNPKVFLMDERNKNRCYERRSCSAGRYTSGTLQYTLQPVRCRIHRISADELHGCQVCSKWRGCYSYSWKACTESSCFQKESTDRRRL